MPYRRRRARDGRRDPRAKPSGARLNSYGPYSHGPYSYGPSRPARALVSPRVAPARVPVNTNVCPCFFFQKNLGEARGDRRRGSRRHRRGIPKKNHAALAVHEALRMATARTRSRTKEEGGGGGGGGGITSSGNSASDGDGGTLASRLAHEPSVGSAAAAIDRPSGILVMAY